jgi:hypothetical protein
LVMTKKAMRPGAAVEDKSRPLKRPNNIGRCTNGQAGHLS